MRRFFNQTLVYVLSKLGSRYTTKRIIRNLIFLVQNRLHFPYKTSLVKALRDPNTLLVIKERDIGFFALFLQVVSVLSLVKRNGFNCKVIVHFGKYQAYYVGQNTWTDYIEVKDFYTDENDRVELATKSFENQVSSGLEKAWVRFGKVNRIKEDLFWTASPFPTFSKFDKTSLRLDYDIFSDDTRKEMSSIIAEHIRFKTAVTKSFDEFKSKKLEDKYVIGIHFRGTDSKHDSWRTMPNYEDMIEATKAEIQQVEAHGQEVTVAVASDEMDFIEQAVRELPNCVYFPGYRSSGDIEESSSGPQGDIMPGFVIKNPQEALKSVIYDYLLLCQSNILIHSVSSSVTKSVLLTNPSIQSRLVKKESNI